MCKFCDNLKNGKKMELYYRTCSSLDNFCDYINGEDCNLCDDCSTKFVINPIGRRKENGDMYINILFQDTITDKQGNKVIIDKMSESINIVYCPICGEKISNEEYKEVNTLPYPLEEFRQQKH